MERPSVLEGRTYKLRVLNTKQDLINIYVTVNDVTGEDGSRRPYEVFFNSSDATLYEWLAGVMVLASKSLRRGAPIREIAADLVAIHSSVTHHFDKGKHHPSTIAAVGAALNAHADYLEKDAAPDMH